MTRLRRRFGWIPTLTLILPLTAFTAYLVHTAIWGPDGYLALEKRRDEIAAQEARLAIVKVESKRLRNLTQRLGVDSVDLDLLDERARAILGYARPDELIWPVPATSTR